MPSGSDDGPLFLVGMMGVGKSSVGEGLARAVGRRFVDLDAVVEAEGETIARLFSEGRQDEFRARERRALLGLDAGGAVVATGGGIVIDAANVEEMLRRGRVVYLRARPETLAARLQGTSRPLLVGHDDRRARVGRITELLAARAGAYERAHLTVDTDALDLDQTIAALGRWLER